MLSRWLFVLITGASGFDLIIRYLDQYGQRKFIVGGDANVFRRRFEKSR